MDNQNIYDKVLQIFHKREEYWDGQAYYGNKTEEERMSCQGRSIAYYSARWILYYAMMEDWENLALFEEDMGI